ncbi:MAG: response regulator [Nitrospira sp.]|nr:MAG: response regulator [Nitrospira sp.]
MNAIVGMAELLQETPLTPDQANYVGRFSRAAGSLMELINAILDFSKIEAGFMALEAVPFDLSQLADTTAELMSGKAVAKKLELLVLVHPDVPQGVVGDPTRLNQVLVNLVSNAIKFTESGHVMLTVEPAPDCSTAHALRFSVSDTGIGIPPDKLRSIFEPFTQVDSSTTRKYGGTGLGLSISHHLVHLMGGHLEADSTVGVGTTFSFTIALPEAPLVMTRPSGQPLELRTIRLLLVDDNDTNLIIVRTHLSRSGIQLLEARSGAQALAILDDAHRRNEPITLAILDYHMPGMDGLDLAQAIRTRPKWASLPLIMHVSDLQADETRRAHSLGITNYLYKPLSRRRLMDSLAMALNLAPVEPVEQKQAALAALQPCHILLVEDLEDNRDVITLFLKDTAYHLDMAENGAVALQKFQTGTYDLVLMDMQMPVMDGLQATAAIRQWEREQQRRPTPIVALTANAFKEETDKSLAAGCTAHVTKPIKKKTLLKTIAQHAIAAEDKAA